MSICVFCGGELLKFVLNDVTWLCCIGCRVSYRLFKFWDYDAEENEDDLPIDDKGEVVGDDFDGGVMVMEELKLNNKTGKKLFEYMKKRTATKGDQKEKLVTGFEGFDE